MEKSYCNRNGMERTQLEHHPPTIKGQREVEQSYLAYDPQGSNEGLSSKSEELLTQLHIT